WRLVALKGIPTNPHRPRVRDRDGASKDGKALAVANRGEVRLYDPRGQVGPVLSHPSPVLSLKFSSDRARLLSVPMEGAVRLWDRKAGSATIVQPSGVSYATLSPDGKVIACSGRGNHVRLYEGPSC